MTKKERKPKPIIFEPDEMNLREFEKSWQREELLKQEGVFFLKDITRLLEIDSAKIKNEANKIVAGKRSPWRVMGARKIWNHWVIRMTVFAPYYRKHLQPRIMKLPKSIDANHLLRLTGTFYLTDVCRLLPFSTHQLRYQAKQNPASKREYGIWKDEKLNAFVVDMKPFSIWIRSLWEGNFKGDNRN